ncbi:MAG: TlpA family protein disulfide reductase, partial [Acidobacteriota bacterium]|nr:TlpA family protein disulfide reductase [Acidobacteriota bacterium]
MRKAPGLPWRVGLWLPLFLLAGQAGAAAPTGGGHQLKPPERIDEAGRFLGLLDYGLPLRTLEGRVVDFSPWQGKVLFVNVFATWCPPCREELPTILRLREATKDLPVEFVFISTDKDGDAVRSFLRKAKLSFPVFLSYWKRGSSIFSSEAIPMTFILDREGRVVFEERGAADWNVPSVRAFLARVAAGSP